MRKAQDEDEDDDDVARRGDVVDAFGHNASSRGTARHRGPWKKRHARDYTALIMKLSGVSVRVEPRNMVNGLVPRTLMRDPTQNQLLQRALQGAIPDMEYTDPKQKENRRV